MGFLSSLGATILGMIWIRGLGWKGLKIWEQAALGYGLGLGILGFGTTFLAIAMLLLWPMVFLLWVAAFAGGIWLVRNQIQASGGSWFFSPPLSSNGLKPPQPEPASIPAHSFRVSAWILITLITLLTFLHGIGQRETYWDSLILYLGYARMMVEEGGIVQRVVGQVGIGLGANYPHLFEFFAAQTAVLFGGWDDQAAQWMAPLAGLAATLLIYATVHRASGGNTCAALASALLFRAYPSSLIYTQYASPYALGILAVAALLFCITIHCQNHDKPSLWATLITAAIACHLNFLMVVLFPVAILALILKDGISAKSALPQILQRIQSLLWPLSLALLLASPWYIRNWLVTGNPVYAFFPEIFGGIHINPEVMESAVREWRLNGDGLWIVGQTLTQKIAGIGLYFVYGSQAWKTAPILVSFGLVGVFMAFAHLLLHPYKVPDCPPPAPHNSWPPGLSLALMLLFGGLWTYAFIVADYYLYQIIPVVSAVGVLAGLVWMTLAAYGRFVRGVLSALVLLIGIAPGLSMGLMGFKLMASSPQVPSPQVQVFALRHLFLPPDTIYRLQFGADWDAFVGLNQLPPNAVVLSHENRHLLHRVDIRIVHLDDWETQALYDRPVTERIAGLDELGVQWYLYVPNEDRHPVNARLGMGELIAKGYFEEVQSWRASRGSLPNAPPHTPDNPIPPDRNVLYRRTSKPKSPEE
jgi:hypothetical protein